MNHSAFSGRGSLVDHVSYSGHPRVVVVVVVVAVVAMYLLLYGDAGVLHLVPGAL